MSLLALRQRFARELRGSWQKSALLAVLLLVGLAFWVPQLLRALSSKPRRPHAAAKATSTPAAGPTHSAVSTAVIVEPKATTPIWLQHETLRQTDPLVRSVEIAAIHGDPFLLDTDQYPPPVLFENDFEQQLSDAREPEVIEPPRDPKLTDRLVLKSTIVGVKRRAALINNRLYYEGREVVVDGQTYILSTVLPRRVRLTQGARTIELTLPQTYQVDPPR